MSKSDKFDSDVIVENNDTIPLENDQVTPEESFKHAVAGLLLAFKELVGNGTWLSVNGAINEADFCVAIAIDEKADTLHKMTMKEFVEDD